MKPKILAVFHENSTSSPETVTLSTDNYFINVYVGLKSAILSKFYKIFGFKVYYWNRGSSLNNSFDDRNKLVPPPREEYRRLSSDASSKFEKYFCDNFSKADIYLLDYIKRCISYDYNSYYSFRIAVDKQFGDENKIIIIAPKFLKMIHNNTKTKLYPFRLFTLFSSLFTVSITFIRAFIGYWIADEKKSIPKDVLFLRKKIAYDLGFYEECYKYLTEKEVSILGSFTNFSRSLQKYGFYYLNVFRGSLFNIINSYQKSLIYAMRDILLFSKLHGLPRRLFQKLANDSFQAHFIIGLDAQIIFGEIHSKPIHILLYRYKKSTQIIASFNESFIAAPRTSYDYCHLDIYYSMNQIEASSININGGNIRNYVFVPFFRKYLKTDSKGISKDLQALIEKYHQTVVVVLNRVPDFYATYDKAWFINSIISIVNIIEKYDDILFVLKEKKNDLHIVSKNILQKLNTFPNCYLIRSKEPKQLFYNQFEDLIPHMNLTISTHYCSTTVWQSLSHNVPVTGIKLRSLKSNFSKFPYFEVTLDKLEIAMLYWLNIGKKEWDRYTTQIDDIVNFGDSDGIKVISHHLISLLNDRKVNKYIK